MRANRFFVKKPLGEETFLQDVSVVHQIKNVLRLTSKDTIVLYNDIHFFDYHYTVVDITKDKVSLRLLKKVQKNVDQRRSVLFLSIIRKELFELAVLKASELGVTDIVPLETTYSQRHFLNKDRLLSILKESSEQSDRNTVPVLQETVNILDLKDSLPLYNLSTENTFCLSLKGKDSSSFVKTLPTESNVGFLVGPEGGWSEEEESFFTLLSLPKISLGTTVLRAETAAIICTYLSFLIRK